jgi:hypothetical protein
MEVSGHFHATAALHPGERVHITHWITGWVGPSGSGRDGEGNNSQLLPWPEPPIIQPLAQLHTTELWRLPIELHEGTWNVLSWLSLCNNCRGLSVRQVVIYVAGCFVCQSVASGKGKVVPVLNWAPRNEDVLGEWRYSSTHSWPRH